MIALAQDNCDDIDASIAQKIMNMGLYRQVKDLIEQLQPVANAIDMAQKDSTNLAAACHIMLNLLEAPQLQPHENQVQHRFNQAIKPCHLVAYMMHPKYNGENLIQAQVEEAKT